MENKYNELEKLNQLKANGTITDTEFEIQKHKILNTSNTINKTIRKKGRAKLFFILTIIGLIITIFLSIGYFYYNYLWATEKYTKNNGSLYSYEDGLISEQEYKNMTKKEKDYKKIYSISGCGALGTGVLTIAFLITGVVFKIREKK